MDAIQTFRNAAGKGKVVELLAGVKKPLPTTFRASYAVSLPIELKELLQTLHRDYGINISRELEAPIKQWAVKKARWINKHGPPKPPPAPNE